MTFLVIMTVLIFVNMFNVMGQKKKEDYNKLSAAEQAIIINKGTERAFTGELLKNKLEGVYVCRQCDQPLFLSADKFESSCGWPSFDDEIKNSIIRVPDFGRTEIVCSNCKAHLGHVFNNEGFTTKNTRHCVNSVSMKFISKDKIMDNKDKEE